MIPALHFASFVSTGACVDPLANVPVLFAPGDGAVDVPTNAVVFLNQPPADVVVEADGVVVDVVSTAVPVKVGYTIELVVLAPTTPFPAGSEVVVRAGDSELGHFTVGDSADVEPPAAPQVTRDDVSGGCGVTAGFDLVDSDAAFVIATSDVQREASGVSVDGHIDVGGPVNTAFDVVLTARDLAGNTASSTMSVTIEDQFVGSSAEACSSTTSAWSPLLLALLLMRGKRRACRSRS